MRFGATVPIRGARLVALSGLRWAFDRVERFQDISVRHLPRRDGA